MRKVRGGYGLGSSNEGRRRRCRFRAVLVIVRIGQGVVKWSFRRGKIGEYRRALGWCLYDAFWKVHCLISVKSEDGGSQRTIFSI